MALTSSLPVFLFIYLSPPRNVSQSRPSGAAEDRETNLHCKVSQPDFCQHISRRQSRWIRSWAFFTLIDIGNILRLQWGTAYSDVA